MEICCPSLAGEAAARFLGEHLLLGVGDGGEVVVPLKHVHLHGGQGVGRRC